MSEPTSKRSRSSKVGKGEYRRSTGASLRAMHGAKAIGRALRMAPAAAVQLSSVQRAETAIAMKNAGYVDNTFSDQFNTVAIVKQIGIVAQGTTISQRVGAKIKWKSIQVRGTVAPQSTQTKPELATLLFIYDRFPGTAVPTAAEIVLGPSSTGMLNDGNRQRFVILRRLDFVVGPYNPVTATGGAVSNSVYFVDEYIKLRGLMATYIGATGSGALGDIRTGALYCVSLGTVESETDCPYTIDMNMRVRFADLQG